MDRYDNKYRIESTRLPQHDYNYGVYHIVICTKNREHSFGEIVQTPYGNNFVYSNLGAYLFEQIRDITSHYSYVSIPIWQVMPDHVHLLVMVNYQENSVEKKNNANNAMNEKMQELALNRSHLSIMISGLKRSITVFAKENGIVFQWQSRFYDQVIWNQEMMNEVVKYIQNNVYAWNVYGNNVM